MVGAVALAGTLLVEGCARTDAPAPVDAPETSRPWTGAGEDHGALLFRDEFDGQELDASRWARCYWWQQAGTCRIASNDEQQWYRPEQVRVADGVLHLVAERRATGGPDGVLPFRSGMVSTGRSSSDRRTRPGFAFHFGYLEARVRVPSGRGLWPALWLLPVTHESRPEIDVLEVRGSRTDDLSMHLHVRDAKGKRTSYGQHSIGTDFAADWHVVALDWERERLRWLVDGTEVWRIEGESVPDEPMYVLANLAVGGDYDGVPDAQTAFPATYQLDYLRVWER